MDFLKFLCLGSYSYNHLCPLPLIPSPTPATHRTHGYLPTRGARELGEGSGQAVLPISRDSSATVTKVLETFNFKRWVENLLTWSLSKSLFYLMHLKIHTSSHSLRRRKRQRETDRQAGRQTDRLRLQLRREEMFLQLKLGETEPCWDVCGVLICIL